MKIRKEFFFKLFFDFPIIFFVIIRESKKLTSGDASQYQTYFQDFVNGVPWPLAAGSEPTWMIFYNLASYIGEYGLIVFISTIILLLIHKAADILYYPNIVSRIFIILLILPFNTVGLYLCNAWRSTLSIFLLFTLLQILYSIDHKKRFLKSIFFLPFLFLSHSSGVFIGILFISIMEIFIPFVNYLMKLKLKIKTLIYFFISSALSLIIIPIFINSSYILVRVGEYFQETSFSDNTNEEKSFESILVKTGLLIFVEICIFFYKKSKKYILESKFHLSFSIIYLLFTPATLISVVIADRLVNSLYWITLLSLIDINIEFLKKYLLPIKENNLT